MRKKGRGGREVVRMRSKKHRREEKETVSLTDLQPNLKSFLKLVHDGLQVANED